VAFQERNGEIPEFEIDRVDRARDRKFFLFVPVAKPQTPHRIGYDDRPAIRKDIAKAYAKVCVGLHPSLYDEADADRSAYGYILRKDIRSKYCDIIAPFD
jgi:hypothetical protein